MVASCSAWVEMPHPLYMMTNGIAGLLVPGNHFGSGKEKELLSSSWLKIDGASTPESLWCMTMVTDINHNVIHCIADCQQHQGMSSLTVIESGPGICWGLNDHVFAINCTNTIRKVPQLLIFPTNGNPLLLQLTASSLTQAGVSSRAHHRLPWQFHKLCTAQSKIQEKKRPAQK